MSISRRRSLQLVIGLAGTVSTTACNQALSEAPDSTPRPQSTLPVLPADLGLQLSDLQLLKERLQRLSRHVGYGRFNVIGFATLRQIARNRTDIGAFTAAELNAAELLFRADASRFGYFGPRIATALDADLLVAQAQRVDGTAHWLLPHSKNLWSRARREVGDALILTSGARGVAKQTFLFLRRAEKDGWNFRQAIRQVAPPAYSYHASGDFDVGEQGLGGANFTPAFAETDTFRRLMAVPGIRLRYPEANQYGVAYEPWHIAADVPG